MIFIDTGAFVARYRQSAEWHELAVRGWAELERKGRRCFTHSLCIGEAVDLIARYGGVESAVRFGQGVLLSEITICRRAEADDTASLELMRKFADQKVGFTDCACFVQMRRHHLATAFSFDRHFKMAGFRLWPPRK